MCACQSLCAYLFSGLRVSLCSCSSALHPRLLLSCGPLSSGNRVSYFKGWRDAQVAQEQDGVRRQEEGGSGERSPFRAKSLSAIWGAMCAA